MTGCQHPLKRQTASIIPRPSISAHLLLLFHLIDENDWPQLQCTFLNDPEGVAVFRDLAELVTFNRMTVLHACARYNPPPSLIKRMLELCPDAISSQDSLGRTPLHVAAGSGASGPMIRVLAEAYPEACTIRDGEGHTPLHVACDSSYESIEHEEIENEKFCRRVPSHMAFDALLTTSASSAVLVDKDGTSPIEHALCSDVDLQTVQLIQRVTVRVMRKKYEEEKDRRAVMAGHRPREVLLQQLRSLHPPKRSLLITPSA